MSDPTDNVGSAGHVSNTGRALLDLAAAQGGWIDVPKAKSAGMSASSASNALRKLLTDRHVERAIEGGATGYRVVDRPARTVPTCSRALIEQLAFIHAHVIGDRSARLIADQRAAVLRCGDAETWAKFREASDAAICSAARLVRTYLIRNGVLGAMVEREVAWGARVDGQDHLVIEHEGGVVYVAACSTGFAIFTRDGKTTTIACTKAWPCAVIEALSAMLGTVEQSRAC